MSDEISRRPRRTYARILALASIVGAAGGLVASVVHALLEKMMHAVWHGLVPHLAGGDSIRVALFVVPVLAAIVVGVTIRVLGAPGEIAAVVDDIHLRHGRLDLRATPAMALTSFATILGGGSLGPEAPLVQIIGSLASSFGDRLRLRDEDVRTLTLSGMAAALSAFFGSALGGALFALELPHRRGLEYFEALLPAVVSATMSHFVFAELVGEWGVPLTLAGAPRIGLGNLVAALGFGLVGAGIGALFQVTLHSTGHVLDRLVPHPIARAILGGLALGAIALPFAPPFPVMPFFFGEQQIPSLVEAASSLRAAHPTSIVAALLVAVGAAKLLAISMTVHSGFRGGFIFPLFFVGTAFGLAIATASNGALDPTLAVLCTMAAVNVAVTKTPLGTALVVAGFGEPALRPFVLAASLVSFVASTRVRVIHTQRGRSPVTDLFERDSTPKSE